MEGNIAGGAKSICIIWERFVRVVVWR